MVDRLINLDTTPRYLNASLKIGWAKHHLRALDSEVTHYLNSKPYTLTEKDDLDAGEYIVELDTKPLKVTMGLIVGDWAACLRGALDHLAYWLTRTKGGTPNDRASFPVVGIDNSAGRKQFNLAVEGIPPDAVTVIKSLQPYNSGNAYQATKLWRLHRLWNIDKHRRIPFHATVAKINIGCPADMLPLSSWTNNDGIFRFPLAAKGHLQFDPTVEIDVHFGDQSEGIIVPYSELIDIHNFVRNDVMPRFKGFFES